MKQKDHKKIPEDRMEEAAREILGHKKDRKVSTYENREPTVEELNIKYKLTKR